MKKILLILLTISIGFSLFSQNRIEEGITCSKESAKNGTKSLWRMKNGNFTANDINGNAHNLQTYLDEGKSVIIDFSCAWCGPCWTLHQSHIFDNLYNTYGPGGTGEIVVLWIEIEQTNTLDQITGTSSGTGRDGFTQGDWTVGGTWPVPIIDDHRPLQPFLELYEGAVPTVFLVTPSGYYTTITTECWTGMSAVYSRITSAPGAGKPPVSQFSSVREELVGNSVAFESDQISVDPITSYSWTFQGGTPATSSEANPTVVWNTAGTYTITLSETNASGTSTPMSKTINIIDQSTTNNLSMTFEEVLIGGSTFPKNMSPYSWKTYDLDRGTVWADFSDQGVSGNSSSFYVYTKELVPSNYPAVYNGSKCAIAMSNARNQVYNNDWLVSPQINLGTNSSLKLYVRSVAAQYGLEKYKIAVSTTESNPSTAEYTVIGDVRTAPASWTEVNVDLSEYDGQNVYIAINYVGENTFIFFVDNIQIISEGSGLSVGNAIKENVNIYPNPANDLLNVNYAQGAKIQVFNMMGQEVANVNNASEYQTINVSMLESGSYFVKITKNDETLNKKIVITK